MCIGHFLQFNFTNINRDFVIQLPLSEKILITFALHPKKSFNIKYRISHNYLYNLDQPNKHT